MTLKGSYSMPIIDDFLDYLSNKNYFSTLDMKNRFHQIPMHENSIKYTAFVTPLGQFEYCYIPFGLKNAGKIVVYLDEVSIATETFEEYLEILAYVLRV
ncbi:hypothetical protein DOY81_007394 [Sarcophaga bullata]|nr:hypothetical protein DOY81_007394 [Sarcophaga bullata]